MLTNTKIALAAALVAATSSVALAQDFDPNLANRYPAYADAGTYGYVAGANNPTSLHGAPRATLQSAPVQLRQSRNVALPTGQMAGQRDWFEIERSDRASSPYAGGM
jgi:hypothetical protein